MGLYMLYRANTNQQSVSHDEQWAKCGCMMDIVHRHWHGNTSWTHLFWWWFKGWRIVLVFLISGVFLDFSPGSIRLVLQQFGNRTRHFAWHFLHFGMFTFHFARLCYICSTSTAHVAWYLLRVGTSNADVGFFRVSFRVSLRFHSGFLWGFS